jgi:hypothetical protein
VSSIPGTGGCPSEPMESFRGKRWSRRASEFKKYCIRLKHAIDEFNIGIVRIKVFIGSDNSEIKDKAENDDEVLSVFPVYFAAMTNTTKVAKDARVVVAFAADIISYEYIGAINNMR